MRNIWDWVLKKFLPVLALLVMLVPQGAARADDAAQSISAASDAIIQLVGPDEVNLNGILQDLGVPPAGYEASWADWQHWTTQRKLDRGYRWAEAHQAGNGREFLRAVARSVAQHNDAIRYHVNLKDFFPEHPDDPLSVTPSRTFDMSPPTTAAKVELADDVNRIIDAIAVHTDGGYPGGIEALVEACCGYDETSARKLMEEAATPRDALARAIKESNIPPELQERILRALSEAASANSAIANDAALAHVSNLIEDLTSKDPAVRASARSRLASVALIQPDLPVSVEAVAKAEENVPKRFRQLPNAFISPREPPPASAMADPGSPSHTPGGGGGGPLEDELFAEANAGWYGHEANGTQSIVDFDKAITQSNGPGGIVLGAEVSSALGDLKPIAAFWQARADANIGRLAVVLSDHSTVYSRYFSNEEGFVARAVVFNQSESGAVRGAGLPLRQAVILASIEARKLSGFALGSNAMVSALADGQCTILNPAIADLSFGRDLLIADDGPRMVDKAMIRGLLQVGAISLDTADKLQALNAEVGRAGYRLFDQPLTVGRKGLLLTANSSLDDPQSRLGLRLITEANKTTSETSAFIPAEPILLRVLPQLAELNDFAELMALDRWLQQFGLTQVKGAIVLHRTTPVGGIIIGKADNNTAPPLTPFRFLPSAIVTLNALSLEINARAGLVLAQNHAPAALIKLNADLEDWRQAWLRTPELYQLALQGPIANIGPGTSLSDIADGFNWLLEPSDLDPSMGSDSPGQAPPIADRDKEIIALTTIPAADEAESSLRSLAASPLASAESVLTVRLLLLVDPNLAGQIKVETDALRDLRNQQDNVSMKLNTATDTFKTMVNALSDDAQDAIAERLSNYLSIGTETDLGSSGATNHDMATYLDTQKPSLGAAFITVQALEQQAKVLNDQEADAEGKIADLKSKELPGWQEWYTLQLSYERAATIILDAQASSQ